MVYIIAPNIPDENIEGAVERVNGVVSSRGGEITKTDIWGRRRLAFPLRDHREGIYVLINFTCEPGATTEMESQLRITDEVLRHLVVRLDKK